MIATLDELVAALGTAQSVMPRKAAVTLVANAIADLYHVSGAPAAAPAVTSGANGELLTRASAGAFPINDATGGESTQIARVAGIDSVSCIVSIADRIWENSLSAFGTAKIPITFPVGAQRYADGENVELYATITTTLANTTAATWTVEFLDQNDVLRTATTAYGTNGTAGRMLAFDLPAGSRIKSVVSFQSSVAQASGAIGLVMLRRLVDVPFVANTPTAMDGISLGLPIVQPGACLCCIVFLGSATSSGVLTAKVDFVQG